MSIRQIIEERRTSKVLGDPEFPCDADQEALDATMWQLLETAGVAPFHYVSDASHHHDGLDSPAPWRFHALSAVNCRRLLTQLERLDAPTGKISNMLAAAQALILVTWLPDAPDDQRFQEFQATLRNMEHIAAASAATQNLLLLATEAGLLNYWSSGGVLRSRPVYELLQIPATQVLLGAVFLFPNALPDVETKPGANRGKQGETARWIREIQLEG